MTDRPTTRVTLNEDDLYFILESISQNVAGDDEKTPAERKTTNKLRRAQARLFDA